MSRGYSIPSVEWLRLQFWSKTSNAKTSLHYAGQFKVRFKVQQHQWRKKQPDSHYADIISHYQCEYVAMMKITVHFLP